MRDILHPRSHRGIQGIAKREGDDTMRAVLLDASAFIMGYEASCEGEYYTTPSVKEEILDDRLIGLRLELALETGKVKLLTPEHRYLERVEEAAQGLGEKKALSMTDNDLLALGLQLRDAGKNPLILTEDYSVQNVADLLGLNYRSLAAPGIRRRFEWIVYCPGCRGTFPELKKGEECPICGTILRRRPVGKRPVMGRDNGSGH